MQESEFGVWLILTSSLRHFFRMIKVCYLALDRNLRSPIRSSSSQIHRQIPTTNRSHPIKATYKLLLLCAAKRNFSQSESYGDTQLRFVKQVSKIPIITSGGFKIPVPKSHWLWFTFLLEKSCKIYKILISKHIDTIEIWTI